MENRATESSVNRYNKLSKKPTRNKVSSSLRKHNESKYNEENICLCTNENDENAKNTRRSFTDLDGSAENLDYLPSFSTQNCFVQRSASAMSGASFTAKNMSSCRLKTSKSAVTFSEMRRLARKVSLQKLHLDTRYCHQSSISDERPQEVLEETSQSIIEQEQSQNLLNDSGIAVEDLFVELSNISNCDQSSSDEETSDAGNPENDTSTTVEISSPLQAEASAAEDHKPVKKSPSFINSYPLCKACGQKHKVSENHEYDYAQDMDDDFLCDICLQPFVDPYDTLCGHTFCCICLKNYVRLKKSCPIDRRELSFIPSQCWQSSIVLRKLADKMKVKCPNNEECKVVLPRANLPAHLKERCPGAVIRCKYSMFGCSYKSRRIDHKEHAQICKFQEFKGNPIDLLYPNREKRTVELCRPDSSSELGLTIVGGNDTPVRNIVVQSVVPGGLIQLDGRIQPGDIIIDVNGEDFHSISHVEARAVLCRHSRLVRFTLLREKELAAFDDFVASLPRNNSLSKKITIPIIKPPSEQLGIKLASFDGDPPGVYVQEIAPGRVAHVSGLFQIGDRILKIANVNVANGDTETAANIIQGASEKFDMVICRRASDDATTTIANPWAYDGTITRKSKTANQTKSSFLPIPDPEILPMRTSHKKKVLSIKKEPHENLGIVVSGGVNSIQGDFPIFVQDIQPMGLLDRDNRIQRGDLLIEINGIRLNGLTHRQAVGVLKSVTADCEIISLIVLELIYSGKEEDFALLDELSGVHHNGNGYETDKISWTPSWKVWLAIPPQYRFPRNVTIRRNNIGEFGFTVCGGKLESGNLPVLLKYVAPQSPASIQGQLRCGDEIIAVNGSRVTNMTHLKVVELLKQSTNSVKLTVMSWPGSSH